MDNIQYQITVTQRTRVFVFLECTLMPGSFLNGPGGSGLKADRKPFGSHTLSRAVPFL